MGPDAMVFIFWMLSFKAAFPLSSFTFIKKLMSQTQDITSPNEGSTLGERQESCLHTPVASLDRRSSVPGRALDESHKLWKGTYKIPGKLFFFPIKNILLKNTNKKKKQSTPWHTKRTYKEFSEVKFLRTCVIFILRDPCGGKSFFF